jgi:hypothetical protein
MQPRKNVLKEDLALFFMMLGIFANITSIVVTILYR